MWSKRGPVLPGPSTMSPVLIYLGVAGICVLSGLLIASNQKLALMFIGALGALAVITQPAALLWLTTLMTLFIAGTMKYFLGGLNITWVAYGMGAALFGSVLLHQIRNAGRARNFFSKTKTFKEHGHLRAIVVVALLAFSFWPTLIHGSPPDQVVAALKSTVMFGGVWCVLALYPFSETTIKNWLKGLIIIGVIQAPIALYQFLFVRAAKVQSDVGQSAADAVVGTFGGNPDGGGLTAVLAVFLVVLLIAAIALYRAEIIDRRQFVLLALLHAGPLLLMEVKVVFFYLPVCLLVLFWDQVYRQPVQFVGGALVAVVMLFGMLVAYQYFHWSTKGVGFQDTLVQVFSYSFETDPDRGGAAGADTHLTRAGVYVFWWDQTAFSGPLDRILGNGLGASRSGGQVPGEIAVKYPYVNLDRTGTAILLWDVGVIGLLLTLILFALQFRSAARLAKSRYLTGWQRALANGLRATSPIFVLSLLYRNDIPYAAPMMFLLMCHFGLVSWLVRQAAAKEELKLAARHTKGRRPAN